MSSYVIPWDQQFIVSRVCTSSKITPSNLFSGYRVGKVELMPCEKLRLYVLLHVSLITTNKAQYAAMPAGIIRGALTRLGLQAVVVPEITTLPQCTPNFKSFVLVIVDVLQVPSK